MALDTVPKLAMHVYRLLLKKGSQIIEYAMIIEVHHPRYMSAGRLKALFAVEAITPPGNDQLDDWRTLLVAAD